MPYVQRDRDSEVKGVYNRLQKGYAEEFLPNENAEVLAYLNPVSSPEETQAKQDIENEFAKPTGDSFEILKALRILGKI